MEGRFQIEREAGAGGMGTIFRAVDRETGRPVALKRVRGLDQADRRRFQREGQALAGLRHPGIVRYVDHGVTPEGEAYVAMEWLDGEDLRARLGRAGLTVGETVTLARKVAEALGALHGQGLVHRDVKPGNLFLVDGRVDDVRIIDFGLVRGQASADLTRNGMALGTPAYMSPEQARGRGDVDARTDLFSLGCVMFKCLTGRTPFEGGGLIAVLARMILDDVPRVRALRPGCAAGGRRDRRPPHREGSGSPLPERPRARRGAGRARRHRSRGGPASATLSAPGMGLTAGERRASAMVLVGPTAGRRLRPDEETWDVGAPGPLPPGAPQAPAPSEEALAALVREHRGHLDTILDGTRVVTFPGASVATDAAARAARCALAIRALLPVAPIALATEWGEIHASQPAGDGFDRAASLLERSARSGGIAIDPVTAALLGGRFEVGEGPELRAVRDSGSDARMLLGKPSAFVGRDWEVKTIVSLFREVIEEPAARVVVVTAAPGMGKSRLAHEVGLVLSGYDEGAETRGVEIWRARGDPLRAGSAFGLLGQALRDACGIQLGEPIETQRARLLRRMAGVPGPRRAAAFLGEIVDVRFPDDALPELRAARGDAAMMADQIRRAWEGLLAVVCAERPVVLLLEDLQWGDLPTVRLVDQALASLGRRPWMVLAFARPEVHQAFPRLWAGHLPQEVRLKPLSRTAAEQLVRGALEGRAGITPETIARVVDLGYGNAFYLEELARPLANRDVAAGRAAAAPLRRSSSFPGTVLAMAQARFDGFDPDERRILRAASVFGEVFWPRAVAALVGPETVSRRLSELLDAREIFVRRPSSRFAGEEEIAFRHTLVREAAYAALTPGDRALGHRLAGAWLEAHGEADAMLLAHHFDLGGDPGRASGHSLRAAQQAMYGLDLDAAVDRARAALEGAPSQEARIEAAELLGEVAAWRWDWAAVMQHTAAVLALAPPQGSAWIHAQALKQSGGVITGRADALEEATAALVAAEPEGEAGGVAMYALSFCTFILCRVGRLDAAAGVVRKVDGLAARAHAGDPLARAYRHMAHMYVEALGAGDAWAALHHAEAARAAYAEAQHTPNMLLASCHLGFARLHLGQAEEAERVLRAVPGRDLSFLTLTRDEHLVHVLLARGALDEPRAMLTARLARAQRIEGRARETAEARSRWLLGAVALRAGDPEVAAREISAALDPSGSAPCSTTCSPPSACSPPRTPRRGPAGRGPRRGPRGDGRPRRPRRGNLPRPPRPPRPRRGPRRRRRSRRRPRRCSPKRAPASSRSPAGSTTPRRGGCSSKASPSTRARSRWPESGLTRRTSSSGASEGKGSPISIRGLGKGSRPPRSQLLQWSGAPEQIQS